ncbi:MAG: hypothetical protein FOGNACKC_00930 [Anaerolineae bacterium]|nr:hypothetical protein [Anaerolineae bacterium]
MQKADYEYSASLDASQVEAELSRVDRQMDDLGKRGDGAMNQIAKSSGGAAGGLQQMTGGAGMAEMAIGAVGGAAAMAAMKIVEMAQQGIAMLKALTDQAIQMNSQVQTAQVLFGNLMKSEEEAKRFVSDLREETQKLGLAFSATTEFAQAILPDSKSVAEFMELLKTTDRYADFEGVQFERLKLAINEAVAGQMTYLRQWLNLSGAQLDRIKELQKEYGQVAGLTKGMQEILEKKGAGSADSFSGTALYAEKSLRGMMDNMKLALGDAPFDEYLEGMNRFNKWLNDNSDHLVDLAYSIGEAFASVMDVVGDLKGDALDSLDVEGLVDVIQSFLDGVVEAANQVHLLIDNIQIFIEAAAPLKDMTFGFVEEFRESVGLTQTMDEKLAEMQKSGNAAVAGLGNLGDAMTDSWNPFLGILSHAGEALTTLNQMIAMASAGLASLLAGIKPIIDDFMGLAEMAGAAMAGDFERVSEIGKRESNILKGNFFDLEAAYKAGMESFEKSVAKMEEADQRREEREQKRKERDQKVEHSTWENPSLADKDPLESEDYKKAKDKLDKALEKQRVADQRRLEDFEEELAEKRLSVEQWAVEDLLKIEEDYQQKRIDLRAKYDADYEAENKNYAKQTLQRDKKHREEREEFEKESNQRRLELEENYQKQLQEMTDDFQRNAQRLAERRDAIAFVELLRSREEALSDAKTQKEEARTTLEEQIAEDRQKMQERQEEEIRSAKETHEERLAMLKERLDEELAAADEKYRADLEKHNETEQKKYDAIEEFIKKRMAAWEKADRRRLEDLQTQMDKEIKIIEDAEKKKAEIQAKEERSKPISQQRSYNEHLDTVERPTGRARGGPVYPGQAYWVGEEGPELFKPWQSGLIVPNDQLMYAQPGGRGMGGSVTYNQQQANLSMLDPTQVSAAQRAQMRQFILEVLMETEA